MFQTDHPDKEYKETLNVASSALEVVFGHSLCHGQSFWTKVSSNLTCLTFGSYGGLMLVCAFLSLRYAVTARYAGLCFCWICLRIYVEAIFQKRFKPSLLKISISSQLVVW